MIDTCKPEMIAPVVTIDTCIIGSQRCMRGASFFKSKFNMLSPIHTVCIHFKVAVKDGFMNFEDRQIDASLDQRVRAIAQ